MKAPIKWKIQTYPMAREAWHPHYQFMSCIGSARESDCYFLKTKNL